MKERDWRRQSFPRAVKDGEKNGKGKEKALDKKGKEKKERSSHRLMYSMYSGE